MEKRPISINFVHRENYVLVFWSKDIFHVSIMNDDAHFSGQIDNNFAQTFYSENTVNFTLGLTYMHPGGCYT